MNHRMSVEEFAKHFDLAIHNQSLGKAEILKYVDIAKEKKPSALYTNPHWSAMVAKELEGTGVRAGGALGFPFGAYTTETKLDETKQLLAAGCTAMDMVVNIGELRDKNFKFVENEVYQFAQLCKEANAWSKIIFEVGFLSNDEIADLTRICCECGIDYVKTSSGTEEFPDFKHVQVMHKHLSGNTKIKVSGVPRTFTLSAILFLMEHYNVDLFGTRSAGNIITQYEKFIQGDKYFAL